MGTNSSRVLCEDCKRFFKVEGMSSSDVENALKNADYKPRCKECASKLHPYICSVCKTIFKKPAINPANNEPQREHQSPLPETPVCDRCASQMKSYVCSVCKSIFQKPSINPVDTRPTNAAQGEDEPHVLEVQQSPKDSTMTLCDSCIKVQLQVMCRTCGEYYLVYAYNKQSLGDNGGTATADLKDKGGNCPNCRISNRQQPIAVDQLKGLTITRHDHKKSKETVSGIAKPLKYASLEGYIQKSHRVKTQNRESDSIPTLQVRSEKTASNDSEAISHFRIKNPSSHFTKVENLAHIPFLHQEVLECDCYGQEYTLKDHDITLRIPEGAIPTGEKFKLEIAVTMYGPFIFNKNVQPISPILWLCFEEKVALILKKPFRVILPHFLTGLTEDKAHYHNIVFAKASHTESQSSKNGQVKYSFQPCDTAPYFASCGGRSYGVLVTNHTCFYCLQANKTPKLAKDAGYCLARIESFNQQMMRNEVHFSAVYFLDTCLKALKEQFPHEEGYQISSYKEFEFEDVDDPYIKINPSDNSQLVVALDPKTAKIRAEDIDFWRKDFDAMQLKHEKKMYPPRIKMTVDMKNPDTVQKLLVKVEGCSEDSQLDVELNFPLSPSFTSLTSSASLSSESQGEPQSPRIICERPKMNTLLIQLLPLATEWRIIGSLLGIQKHVLDKIRADEAVVHNCLHEMLAVWLKQIHPPPTWAVLAEAVKSVDEAKAHEIKIQHIDISDDH